MEWHTAPRWVNKLSPSFSAPGSAEYRSTWGERVNALRARGPAQLFEFSRTETGQCTRHIGNTGPRATWQPQERDANREGEGCLRGYCAYTPIERFHLVSVQPEVPNRFSRTMLQSELMWRPSVIRMLLLLLELRSCKKHTGSCRVIKRQMNKKVSHW